MLRILLTMMCLCTCLFCFSNECPNAPCELPEEARPYIYIGYGMGNVLQSNYETALCYLDTATSLLNPLDKTQIPAALMIAFTKAVIYDNLGRQEKCEQTIGSIFLMVSAFEEEEDVEDALDAFFDENDIMTHLMRDVASMAPSFAVRNLLLSLVEDETVEDIFFNDTDHLKWNLDELN